ncbi:hypothetical protein AB6A40_006876 [Gnathostoma spinigerum]|uniref:Major facilitator superfamily (MFS) profile domain-containing protein n=1 Tax=Gnathostoma spinigerum TaxID=75299 RepID=A0ABD6EUD1_9BILA
METSTVMSKGTKKVSNEPSNRRSRTPSSAPGYYAMVCSQRLTLAIVGFFGCLITFALRTDLSFAIVCMVNETAINVASGTSGHKHSMCLTDNQTEKIKEQHPKKNGGNLPWTKQDQGYVLSSYFWGYVSSQILSGYLAGKFGGRLIFGLSTFFGSIVTLASPFVASTNIHIFVILRGILGFVQGSLFPAFHTLWSAWSPPMERSILTGITYAGDLTFRMHEFGKSGQN